MGTITTNLKFYKPSATEFVDVENQLNRNWDIADKAVKRLLEYEYSNLPVPDTENTPERSRFYKPYSNSLMAYFPSGKLWYQDPTARVYTWATGSLLNEGFFSHPDFPIYYRIIKKSGGTTAEVEWTGAFWELGGNMELNTNVQVMGGGAIPPEASPVVNKYFDVWAGNTSTNYSIARILIGTDGRMEFKRYGANPTSGSDENRIELTGIKYNVEVTGT